MDQIPQNTQNTHQTQKTQSDDRRPVLRYVRDSLVDLFVALAKILFFWIPGDDTVKGKALMVCHPIFLALIVALFFILPYRHPLRAYIVVLCVLTVCTQWLLGGCVVTRAEQRLTGSTDTFLDPFLVLAGVHVNRDTRIAATLIPSTVICAILVWSFLCDYVHPKA